jgi:hypothetical protein
MSATIRENLRAYGNYNYQIENPDRNVSVSRAVRLALELDGIAATIRNSSAGIAERYDIPSETQSRLRPPCSNSLPSGCAMCSAL